MGLAVVHSRVLVGLTAHAVAVEVHLANGLPSFTLVGLADTEVKEARERVRSAIVNAGLDFPNNQRITVNLAPADLPKDSGRLDLAIAMGILAANGQIDGARLAGWEFAGELSLSGALRPVRGALAMGLALRHTTPSAALVLPPGSAEEAALVPDARVFRAHHLLDVVAQWALPGAPPPEPSEGWSALRAPQAWANGPSAGPDMADVKGQAGPKRALTIAAAGGHSVLLSGPPGSGKSMLAQRLAGLLPPLGVDEALESAAIASLAGRFELSCWGQRPTGSPHHTASAVALVGGGSPPRPGEISLAHHGVLFLDELPEFARSALEALREPLETGTITIARAGRRAEFPARFQLVAAMNPCPCGHAGNPLRHCRCTPDQIARYQHKLSGPLLERIDLHVNVPILHPNELMQSPPGERSERIAERCAQARATAMARQGCANHALQGQAIDEHTQLADAARALLQTAASRLALSGRAIHRTLKVARTIADLADSPTVQAPHIAEALQYRAPQR